MRYSCILHGKEIMCDGRHFADAIDPVAANLIVDALNAYDQARPIDTQTIPLPLNEITVESYDGPQTIIGTVHHVERQGDEYFCSACNVRWDASEGRDAHL